MLFSTLITPIEVNSRGTRGTFHVSTFNIFMFFMLSPLFLTCQIHFPYIEQWIQVK